MINKYYLYCNKMPSRLHHVSIHPGAFLRAVFSSFRRNQGFLLAGAIAYYTLLSIIPMLALILIVLMQFQSPDQLLNALREILALVTPGQVDIMIEQIRTFLQNWKVIGLLGFMLLIFFSSFAFTALENAMSVIFFHRVAIKRRHFLISAVIPYLYILLLALGMLIVTTMSGYLHTLNKEILSLFGLQWSLGQLETWVVYIVGILGEVLLLTSLYLVMPVGRLSFRHALIGGVSATILWEISRHVLIWYFTQLSLVNVIYGAFAASIIILVSLEVAAIILLLGAQVIAEYERIEVPG